MTGQLPAWVVLLAQEAPRNTGPDFGKAAPSGLIVVVLLLVAVFGLVFSMNRHLRRLPETFDPEHPEPDQAADDGTVESAVAPPPDADAARDAVPDPPGPRDGS